MQFNPGTLYGVIGPAGAGKTTLFRLMLHLMKQNHGTITYTSDGAPIKFSDARASIAYMPQSQSLYADLSVDEHLDFFRRLYGIPDDEYKQKKAELLHMARLDKFLDRTAGNLSGGMYKKLGLICALLRSPRVMLLDEPTTGVAPMARVRFWSLIKKLAADGKTIFVTTHYMDEAENCDRIALMRAGELIAIDSPANLKKQTFGDSLYNFTPRVDNPVFPPKKILDICEPYGRHWHIRFRDGVDVAAQVAKYKKYFDIKKISPSLEDVFIRLVEGQNR